MVNRVAILIVTVASISSAQARNDLAQELKSAQAALSAGQYDAAYPLYLSSAQKGNSLAQFTVGMFHDLGWGSLPTDPALACNWFEKSAQGDIPTAAHLLAECFRRGTGRPPDPAMAARWYERAAGLGHYLSLCSLAELYMVGQGVARDPKQGLALCRQAAEKGALGAKVQVGRYLLEGDDSIRDPQAAHDWFESAATASPQARFYLGRIHREGLGTEPAPDEARTWFEQAASEGYVPAYFQTARLYFEISPDIKTQRLSADDLAKTYMWLSATVLSSQDPQEVEQARAMLDQVLAVMPASWVPTLDVRVAAHLDKFKFAPSPG
jgi:TPR repeat protein